MSGLGPVQLLENSFPRGRCWDISPTRPRVLEKDSNNPPRCSHLTSRREQPTLSWFSSLSQSPAGSPEKAASSWVERAHSPTSSAPVARPWRTRPRLKATGGGGGLSPGLGLQGPGKLGPQEGARSLWLNQLPSVSLKQGGAGGPGRAGPCSGQSQGGYCPGRPAGAERLWFRPALHSAPSCGFRQISGTGALSTPAVEGS